MALNALNSGLANGLDSGSLAQSFGLFQSSAKASAHGVDGSGDSQSSAPEGSNDADFAALLASVLNPTAPIDPISVHPNLNGNSLQGCVTDAPPAGEPSAKALNPELIQGLASSVSILGTSVPKPPSNQAGPSQPASPQAALSAMPNPPVWQPAASNQSAMAATPPQLVVPSPVVTAAKTQSPGLFKHLESLIQSTTQGLYASLQPANAPLESPVAVLASTAMSPVAAIGSGNLDSQTFLLQLAAQNQGDVASALPLELPTKVLGVSIPIKPFPEARQVLNDLKAAPLPEIATAPTPTLGPIIVATVGTPPSQPLQTTVTERQNSLAISSPEGEPSSTPTTAEPSKQPTPPVATTPEQVEQLTKSLSQAVVNKPAEAIAAHQPQGKSIGHLPAKLADKLGRTKNAHVTETAKLAASDVGDSPTEPATVTASIVSPLETPELSQAPQADTSSAFAHTDADPTPVTHHDSTAISGHIQANESVQHPRADRPIPANYPKLDLTGIDIAQPLANTLSQAVQNHKPAVTLQLTPENLGSLRIHISTGADNQISARLVVSHPEALTKLDATLQELRQNLEAKGIHVDQLRVTLAGEASTTIASQHLGSGGSHPRHENRPDGTGLSNAAAHNPFGGHAANGGNAGNAFGQNAYETFQGMSQDLQQQSTWRQFNGQEPSQASGGSGHSPAAKGLPTDHENTLATSPTPTRLVNPDGTISLLI